MYVRLAFSVAAHMEPDILLVDEVLAVGDAEFQKKCLGKMEEVTQAKGRTILFVSHNMAAIQRLCPKTVWLEKGKVKMFGETEEVVNHYLGDTSSKTTEAHWGEEEDSGDDIAKLISARLINKEGEAIPYVYSNKEVGINIEYKVLKNGYSPLPNIHVFTNKGEYAFISHADFSTNLDKVGLHKATVWIPENLLNCGTYIIGVAITTMIPPPYPCLQTRRSCFSSLGRYRRHEKNDFNQRIPGVVRPRLVWKIETP